MKKTGAQVLIDCLKREGVTHVFGYPGGVVLNIFDYLYNQKDIKLILTRHEQGAVHAADGYARASGKPGVALVTSGPGATNTVTGIATASMDSIPIVVFSGQVPTMLIGNDAFQEADIVGITRPCTKYNYLIKDPRTLSYSIREAFYIATTGRPGPVLIDLPKDVTAGEYSDKEMECPDEIHIRSYNPTYEGNMKMIKEAVNILSKAKRPVILAGGGIILSEAHERLREFSELMQVPVTTTLMGLGGFPGTHELFLGMPGMHGTFAANMSIQKSDVLLCIGARFDDRVTGNLNTFAKDAKIIHVDIDPTSIRKNIRVDIPIVGDCSYVLNDMLNIIKGQEQQWIEIKKAWIRQILEWKKERPLTYEYDDEVIKPQYVVEKIYELTQGDAIISTEVGQNQMWAAQFYKYDYPRRWLSSGGLGTMGYGFPAAIGAQVACPDKIVFDIAGDGSIQMNIQELATAVIEKLPVKVAILNNQYLGMVRQWQEIFFEERYSHSHLDVVPDFVKVAEAYGAVGLKAERPEEVEDVIRKSLEVTDRPVFMDFKVYWKEKVFPMVPPGASIDEMIFEEKKKKSEKKLRVVK
jgi:acetolactate synthase-1/2/3 large subunit